MKTYNTKDNDRELSRAEKFIFLRKWQMKAQMCLLIKYRIIEDIKRKEEKIITDKSVRKIVEKDRNAKSISTLSDEEINIIRKLIKRGYAGRFTKEAYEKEAAKRDKNN